MNICFVKGKIVNEVQFEFMLEKNKNAIIIFYIQLENDTLVRVIGYNEIADKCYQNLKKGDIVWIEGSLENKNELQIIIKKVKKYI